MGYGKGIWLGLVVGGYLWAAGGPRPSPHTVFRAPIKPADVRSRFPSFEAMRTEVDRETYLFRDVFFPLMREVPTVEVDGRPVPKPRISQELAKKLDALERSQSQLVEAAQRLARNSSLSEEAKLKELEAAFDARERALEAFRSQGTQEGTFAFTEHNRFGLAEAIDLRVSSGVSGSGQRGPSGSGQVPSHTGNAETAKDSSRAPGPTRSVALTGTFLGERKLLDQVFRDYNASRVVAALRDTYPAETVGDRAEQGFTVFKKTKELADSLRALRDRGELKLDNDQVNRFLESLIRSEATSEQMEAMKLIVHEMGADPDAASGINRMLTIDIHLRSAVKSGKLKPELVEQRMAEWLRAGEDFRLLVSADVSREPEVFRDLVLAARNQWIETGTVSWAAIKSKIATHGSKVDAYQELVEKAARKLGEAKEPGKGEDAALLAAMCSGECRGHFAIQCRVH